MTADDEPGLFRDLPRLKPLSSTDRRLIRHSTLIEAEDPDSILYQHTVFCQTGMPYRNPGDEARIWERQNGTAHLEIIAGKAMHPQGHFMPVGLPYGPKARLILAHLNAEALRSRCPEIEMEASLTAFVKRLGLASKGQNVNMVKDQLTRLSASSIRLGVIRDGRAITVNSQIVSAFDLWFEKDDRQRVMWPSTVRLSLDYFESLKAHAVPLDERALAALSHSAMGLDIYAWLAQRLHRIEPRHRAFVPWTALQAQFGWHYHRLDNFKRVFRETLKTVTSQYQGARFELDGQGMTLRHSQPPIKGRMKVISNHQQG